MTVSKITSPPSQKAVVDKINEVIDNMAGTITVDQTYDGTSSNPQSGVAINGAKFIQNTATGTDSITIGGTANSNTYGINIGKSAFCGDNNCVAIGYGSSAYLSGSTAIGYFSYVNAVNSIQIGYGVNNTANSLQIGFGSNNNNYQLLDGTTGLIPDARISTNIAKSDLSNITNTGKIAIAHNAMPTTSEVVVSSIANGGTYVAAHDGYLIATGKQVIAGGGFVQLSGNAVSSSWVGSGMTGNSTYTTIPVKKGLTVTVVWYGFSGGVSLNFAPCIGSENEV